MHAAGLLDTGGLLVGYVLLPGRVRMAMAAPGKRARMHVHLTHAPLFFAALQAKGKWRVRVDGKWLDLGTEYWDDEDLTDAQKKSMTAAQVGSQLGIVNEQRNGRLESAVRAGLTADPGHLRPCGQQ